MMSRIAVTLAALMTSGLIAPPPATADQADKPNLMSILTAADAQTQLMALTLTVQAQQQGAKVRVLLCGPAGDLALKEPPAAATAPQKPAGTSPHGLLNKLIDAGAPVDVCAIYLPNKGIGAEALLSGVEQGRPDVMAGHMIAPNTRILSF